MSFMLVNVVSRGQNVAPVSTRPALHLVATLAGDIAIACFNPESTVYRMTLPSDIILLSHNF